MTKKAVLVEFSVATSIIVDIPEGKKIEDDDIFEIIGEKALKKVRKATLEDKDYPYLDNIVEIKEDKEVPCVELDE